MLKLVRQVCLGIVLACMLGLWGLGQLLPPPPRPQEVTVCPEGLPKCDFSSIQLAVDSVASGGIVHVLPAEYVENIDIFQPLTLRGLDPDPKFGIIRRPIIRPKDPKGEVINVHSDDVTIEGLIIDGGLAGIWVGSYTKGTLIRNNVIILRESGSGIYGKNSQLTIDGNSIILIEPPGSMMGEGISIYRSDVKIVKNHMHRTGISIQNCECDESNIWGFFNSALIEGNSIIGNITVIGAEVQLLDNLVTNSRVAGVIVSAQRGILKGNVIMNTINEESPIFRWGHGMVIIGFCGALELEENVIVNNQGKGIVLGLVGCGELRLDSNVIMRNGGHGIALMHKQECFTPEEYLPFPPDWFRKAISEFPGRVVGLDNIIAENGAGDLCPKDYPWPAGFKK